MFKVTNSNTRKRCLLISKITLKTSERCHLTNSHLPDVTVQNHILESLQCQFAIKSLPSVLLSSSTARNFNNSRPIYVILWEMRNNYLIFDSWKIQNVSIFYFWKSNPKNGNIFQLFTLYSKGHHFSITKLDILIFCNILHLEIDFWNLSSKRIVSLWTFWQKCREKHYKLDIEKNGITYSTARNLKTAYLWNFHFH